MIERPKAAVLVTTGSNCDQETKDALTAAGANAEIVHINDLVSRKRMSEYPIIAWPGGFANGDDIASGRVLASEMLMRFEDQILEHGEQKGKMIGICNGFQTMVRMGLLPFGKTIKTLDEMDASLVNNKSAQFECRWVRIKSEPDTKCEFLRGLEQTAPYYVAHGEGRFYAPEQTLTKIEAEKLVVFRYVDNLGNPTMNYPDNPNDSLNAIAAICDITGNRVGFMPHPEKNYQKTQYQNWRREPQFGGVGLEVFKRMVDHTNQS